VADCIEKLQKNPNPQNPTQSEIRTVNPIQRKPKNNDAMITTPDKGNYIVILPIQQYKTKIEIFLDKSNFQISISNPTEKKQHQRKTAHL